MSSGGGKAKTPTLLNDNLKSKQFLRVLDLISEGPIYGPVDTEHLSSVMLNKTQVTNKDGDISINGVAAAWRNGSEFQEPINGFDYLESTVIVSKEVTKETPLVRTVTNKEVDRVRLNLGVSSLVQSSSSGDQQNTSVQLAIDIKSGAGNYVTKKVVTIGPGKISGEYLEAHIVDAPTEKPFDIRVRRITEDSKTDTLQNGTIWNSYTEITDDRLSYPCSAIVGVVVDRDQFKDTPNRNYHMRGIIVNVPDNYDPFTRSYSGVWLGGFKKSWTNNPAWLFRELIKNNRFGLAKRVGYIEIDDGKLYALAQYCDQLVSDGFGGEEPRFTLNAYITKQEKAKAILDNIASMLRGSAVWDGSYFSMLLDMPSDPISLITNANVIDGKFTRNSTPSNERFNAVIVSWVDPENGWETSKEYVSDDISIANDGYKETTIEAFGCTSRGQAYRTGRWLLETAMRETSKISFSMARDAIAFMPGDIVQIADNQLIGTRVGGRVVSIENNVVSTDSVIDINDQNLTLSMMGPNGKPEQFDVDYIDGNDIHLTAAPIYFKEHSPFIIAARSIKPKLYRITNVKEEESNSIYKISATEHNPNKQAIVDNGAVFEQPNDTINAYRAPSIERLRVINVNSSTVQTSIAWETSSATKGLSFEVKVYSSDEKVIHQYETELFSYDFFGLDVGGYFVGVRAKIINGMKGPESQVEMNIGAPQKPSNVQVESVFFGLKATPSIAKDNSVNTMFEFWGSDRQVNIVSEIETKAQRLGRGSFWIKDGLKEAAKYWFYVRTINPFGVSDFVEAVGVVENPIAGIIDNLDEHFMTAEAGKQLDKTLDWLNEACLINMTATYELQESLLVLHGESRAEVKELKRVYADSEKAWAEKYTTVNASINGVKTEVKELDQAIATLDSAFSQSVKEINSSISNVQAGVIEQGKAIAKLDSAFAESQTQLQVKFDEQEALINTKMQAEFKQGAGYAMHSTNITIVVDDKKYNAAGMVISAELKNGKIESFIGFNANNFAFYNPVNGKMEPFLYMKNGQVFMNEVFISKAWLNEVVVTDKMTSANYVPGKMGFNIDAKTGEVECHSILISGNFRIVSDDGQLLVDNTGVAVFDESKRWAVKLGRRPV